MAYKFPTGVPVEGQIEVLTPNRKIIYRDGKWCNFINTAPVSPETPYALSPVVSSVQPDPETAQQDSWFNPETGVFHVKTSVEGVTTWEPTQKAFKSVVVTDGIIDLDVADLFILDMTVVDNRTLVITGGKEAPVVNRFVLQLTNGASGVVSWHAGASWEAGVPPTLTAGVDILEAYRIGTTGNWHTFILTTDSKQEA